MNKFIHCSSSIIGRHPSLLVVALVLSCLGAALTYPSSIVAAKEYTANYAGAMDWANDFCAANKIGVGDYVWLTAPDGKNTVTAKEGAATATVLVRAAGKYCDWYGSAGAGSVFSSNRGDVNGTFAQYPNNGAGNTFGGQSSLTQVAVAMDIRGMQAGEQTICMTLTTFTWGPSLGQKPSPPACSKLTLVLTPSWSTTAESKVSVNFTPPNVPFWPAVPPNGEKPALPGSMLRWRHTISAADGTTPQLKYAIGKSGFYGTDVWGDGSAANHNKPNDGVTRAIGAGSSYTVGWSTPPTSSDPSRSQYSTYRVKASDGGRTLCQSISWGPTASNNAAWTSSTGACVEVPYNYNLLPSVSGLKGMGSVGSTIPPVTPKVNNQVTGTASETTDSPANSEWRVRRIDVGPGKTIPMTQQENTTDPCTYFKSGGATNCDDKGTGTQSFPARVITSLPAVSNEKIDARALAGTRICYTLSVRPYSQADSRMWRHSAPVCITVSKQPKVQVWGSDVRARGSVDTGTTVISQGGTDKLFGSWVEYGGFSVGGNDGFASGSGLNNGNTDTASADVWHKLTFANIDSRGRSNYGGFDLPPLPNLSAQFMGPATGTMRADIGSLASGTYRMNNFTITGGAIDNGKTIIIISTGTVTISGDITYKGNGSSGTFNSVGELPQVIIIANTINITNGAGQINAWLLTTRVGTVAGSINTCWAANRTVTAPLNSTVCDKQLTINGPVVTERLHLRRTAGSDTVAEAGKPAEIFNLRPDAYLWAQARASRSGKVQTVYSVELPPRF